MSELEPLIADLALILICAGAMTLLFKRLKQPVVLGYIVAGFIASPNMPYMPSVSDMEGIHLWSEIGVIFLLFALGLEFSFKKILKMGTAPIIAACTIILAMMLVGAFTGHAFGWKQMDCIYLGGMLAMSSTTIIFKAFDELGFGERFSIVDFYLKACADHPIYAAVPEDFVMVDVGKFDALPEAEATCRRLLP